MNDDYGKTQTVKQLIEEAAGMPPDRPLTTPTLELDQAATVKALHAHLDRADFLKRDRARMEAIQMEREKRGEDPEKHRQAISGMRAAPNVAGEASQVAEMPKKEADLTSFPCAASIDSLTRINEGPRMGQISAQSLLIAAAGLIPTQPTETQWSAIKEAIYSLPSPQNEE